MPIFGKLIFLVVGIIFTVIGARMAYYSKISGSWPTAPAVITESKVVWDEDNDGNKTAKAEVSYNFQVGTNFYTGDTVSYDDYGSSFVDHAQGIVDEFPVGKTTQIHYDPASPASSSVIRGGSVGFASLIFLGIGVLFVGIAALVILKDIVFLGIAFFLSR